MLWGRDTVAEEPVKVRQEKQKLGRHYWPEKLVLYLGLHGFKGFQKIDWDREKQGLGIG